MPKNMGKLDKGIRIVLALAAFGLYYAGIISGTLGIVLLALAVIFVVTSLLGFCPLYYPFKFSTRTKGPVQCSGGCC